MTILPSTPQPTGRARQPRSERRLGFLPGWRTFTYVILAFNLLMLIWIIAGAASASGTPNDCGSLDATTCDDASDVGTAIGIGILIALWAFGDIILGVLWLITNRGKKRDCPVCGRGVKRGQVRCGSCGYRLPRSRERSGRMGSTAGNSAQSSAGMGAPRDASPATAARVVDAAGKSAAATTTAVPVVDRTTHCSDRQHPGRIK